MTTSIIPFDSGSKLPAYLSKPNALMAAINADVISQGPVFSVLSIKGMKFTLVKGKEKKLLTREIDGEEEPVQSLQVTVVRANTKSRVFYAKAYVEGDSDGAKPTCFSHDGVAPDAHVTEAQSKKCQGCPQNVWGVRDGKGTACAVNTRLAVVDPQNFGEPFLLRVPAASRKGFAEAVAVAENRNIPYNAMVLRMSFDKESPSPKLVFKPVGLLDDATYAKVSAIYEDDLTMDIVGTARVAPATDADVGVDELDAAIAARQALKTAAAPPKVAPKKEVLEITVDDIDEVIAKPEAKAEKLKAEKPKAEKPKAEKPKAVPSDDEDDILGDLNALLSNSDD